MDSFEVEVKYTATYIYRVRAESEAEALSIAKAKSSPIDNIGEIEGKTFRWSTAKVRREHA